MPSKPAKIELPEVTLANRKDRYFKAQGQEFATRNAAGVTHLDLYDEIGPFGVTAKDFRAKLSGASGDVVLRINSPGGHVFEGIGIYNDLLAHNGHIRIEVVGVAASIASLIAMAGDEIAVADGSFLMIHNAWGLTVGNRHDHDEASSVLEKIDDSMASTYSTKSGIDVRTIATMLDNETWMTGKEAKAKGFATEVIAAADQRAKFDLSIYAKAPVELRDEVQGNRQSLSPSEIDNVRDYEKFLREAGFPRSRAKALAAGGFKADADRRDVEAGFSELAAFITAKSSLIKGITQ
jgi:ATP-dependent Clp protease protease subunit